MTATFYVGDAVSVMNRLPEKSVDLILTSPPFLALRSYLPADHPDKALEGGSQATPGAFIDWLIDVVEACDRVLAPHGSLCIELGDTYAGSVGAGGDYYDGGLREGQPTFKQTSGWHRGTREGRAEGAAYRKEGTAAASVNGGTGWPLAKSLSLIPELFRLTLVYGFNPLTGRQTDRWRLRNVVRWVRPNPPVGALGDKFRPATSELMVFCKSAKRYFDLDSVRGPLSERSADVSDPRLEPNKQRSNTSFNTLGPYDPAQSAGAPPLDWWNIPLLEGEEPTKGGPKPKGYDPEERRTRPVQQTTNHGGSKEARQDFGEKFYNAGNPNGAPPLDWWNIPPGGYSGTVMWTAKKPVDPRESVGDIWRTTSADCPVHADRPDQAPTAPHDEPVSEDRPGHSPDTDTHPVQEPLAGSVPIGPRPLLNLEDGSSDSTLPLSTPSAKRRSKASSKKVPVPATTILDTACDRTADRTGDTSTGLLTVEPHPDKPANRTSLDGQDEAQPGTSDHIVDTSSEPFDEACTCSYWVAEAQSTSHYAVFPPELCVKPVKAMCPEKVCRVCGEPSRRIVDLEPGAGGYHPGNNGGSDTKGTLRLSRTLRAESFSDCGHDDWRPGLVLDPFGGSGTTALVATGHGRDCWLIDLDERNYDLALERVGPLVLSKGEVAA